MNRSDYPYLPEGREHGYVGMDNEFMSAAKDYARQHSLDPVMPNGCVFVKNGEIVAKGANGSDYHNTHECERVKRGIPTGQGYELCEGCHPKNHGEPKAIATATAAVVDLAGSDVYLWGHWWCCEPCWSSMISAGVNKVYLLERSEILFNKQHPDNIVGKQFS